MRAWPSLFLLVPVGLSVLAAAAVAGRASPPTRCSPRTLVVWLDTEGNGAAGSSYYRLQLTNLSQRRCTLEGYPGVSAVDLAGRRLGDAASRDRTRTPRRVILAAGATATAVLRIVDAYNFPNATCRRRTAAGLRVYPPGQRLSQVVPFPFPACSRRGVVYLSVQPVRPR